MTAGPYTASHYPPIFGVWKNMLQRCTNPNNAGYKNYGGRGISVCKRWMNFESFYADMGEIPPGMTLDRRDNNKGYSPRNCRWATYSQQAKNSRRAKFIRVGKVALCISDWCRKTGITYGVYKARVRKGWTQKKALTTPAKRQRNNVYRQA